jgi:hypothetical protein
MARERLKVVCVGTLIGLFIVGILGFILGAILGGVAQAEGKAISWVIGGVLGAIVGAIIGGGCGAIWMLQAYATVFGSESSKDPGSSSHSPDGIDPST